MLLGAAKSGTTSMADYLAQHPDVYFSSRKEPNFFALKDEDLTHPGPVDSDVLFALHYSRSLVNLGDYLESYAAAKTQKIRADASVRYLYYPKAAERIAEAVPDARLVAILREPVARLYSHYCMNVQYQVEPLPLIEALEAEQDRIAAGWGWDWHYASIGCYSKQIERYLKFFDQEQLMVILYDDFLENPLGTYHEICTHLGISTSYTPNMSKRGKVASAPKNLRLDRWLHWPSRSRSLTESILPNRVSSLFLSKLASINSTSVPALDQSTRDKLMPVFDEDIAALEHLLGRNIPWRKYIQI